MAMRKCVHNSGHSFNPNISILVRIKGKTNAFKGIEWMSTN